MRIALPIWRGCVSPVFDVARRVLVVDLNGPDAAVHPPRALAFGPAAVEARALAVAQLGVEVLICCAVSRPLGRLLAAHGVQVIPGIVGEADAVIRAFALGRLDDPAFHVPGEHAPGQTLRWPVPGAGPAGADRTGTGPD